MLECELSRKNVANFFFIIPSHSTLSNGLHSEGKEEVVIAEKYHKNWQL